MLTLLITAGSAQLKHQKVPTLDLVLNLANYARVNDYGFVETPYRKVINAVIAKDHAGHIATVHLEDEKGK